MIIFVDKDRHDISAGNERFRLFMKSYVKETLFRSAIQASVALMMMRHNHHLCATRYQSASNGDFIRSAAASVRSAAAHKERINLLIKIIAFSGSLFLLFSVLRGLYRSSAHCQKRLSVRLRFRQSGRNRLCQYRLQSV